MKIFTREETYSSTKHFGSFFYWEFVDGISSVLVFIVQLWMLHFVGLIDFVWHLDKFKIN